jgi:hypothetical protein
MKAIQYLTATVFVAAALFSSCKKDGGADSDAEWKEAYAPVNVLSDNSQFEHIWDTTAFAQTFGSFGFSDMTIQDGHLLNFAYVNDLMRNVGSPSFTSNSRRTLDLNTMEMVSQPQYAKIDLPRYVQQSSSGYGQKLYINSYRPYTNEFITLIGVKSSTYDHTVIFLYGDVSYTGIGTNGNYYLSNVYDNHFELGYRDISVHRWYYNILHLRGLNPNPKPHFYTVLNLSLGYFVEKIGPYEFDNGNTNGNNLRPLYSEAQNGKCTLFATTRKDNKLVVAEYDDKLLPSGGTYEDPTPATFITSVSYIPYYPTETSVAKTYRTYSKDGKQMGLAIYHDNTKQFYTFTYNFESKVLTKVLDGAGFTYGDALQSDFDLDENGNIYYAGYAGNGSNQQGISIYKISLSGTTLVGNDNFLKFGEVVKLKYLLGKIYLAVQGRKTGTQVQQLSVIRQK